MAAIRTPLPAGSGDKGPVWAGLAAKVTHGQGWWQPDSGTLPADLGLRGTACSFLWEREGDRGGNYYFIN